ncbi:conserved uncharacterized protein 35a-like protein-2 [Microplitis demolitor]|nr:conserved uncharacterized protein 35a-like protein-3 [Microplitis demolitor]KAG6558423.1 conserved uncharacterized protein 35a-like protein-2 [Microplitis demolitor]
MSKLNNKNSNPTIPVIPWDNNNSVRYSSNNYAGPLLNNIKFSESNIKNNIIQLTNFINTLIQYINNLCGILMRELKNYINNLKFDSSSAELYKDFKHIDGTYKKLIKTLEDFSVDITKDYNRVLRIAIDIDLLRKEYVVIKKEYNELRDDQQVDVNNSYVLDYDRGLKRDRYLNTSLKLKSRIKYLVQSHNKKFADYNEFNFKMNMLIANITNGRIIYTSMLSNKNYIILLKQFVDDFGKLVKLTDPTSKKRGQIISKLVINHMKDLNRLSDEFQLHPIKKLNDIVFN